MPQVLLRSAAAEVDVLEDAPHVLHDRKVTSTGSTGFEPRQRSAFSTGVRSSGAGKAVRPLGESGFNFSMSSLTTGLTLSVAA